MPVSWTEIATITVNPNDGIIDVGGFSLASGDDTLYVDVQAPGADAPWPWSYGILSWQSSFGRELGSIKAYTRQAGEVFRLGIGRTPRSLSGRILYEPRGFNLAWLELDNTLTLTFRAASDVLAGQAISSGGIAFPVLNGTWTYNPDTQLVNLQL